MSVFIESVGVEVPERRVSNDELAQRIDTSDDWIRSHTGIGSRHIAEDGTLTSDLASAAARKALEEPASGPRTSTSSSWRRPRPTISAFPRRPASCKRSWAALGCPAFDLTAGCTGFIYALEVATSLLETNRRAPCPRHRGRDPLAHSQLGGSLHLCPPRRRGGGRGAHARRREGDSRFVAGARRRRFRSRGPEAPPVGAREDLLAGHAHRAPARDERQTSTISP